MNRTRQDKTAKPAKPAVVELNEAALDRAAGGGVNAFVKFSDNVGTESTTSVKSIRDGTSN